MSKLSQLAYRLPLENFIIYNLLGIVKILICSFLGVLSLSGVLEMHHFCHRQSTCQSFVDQSARQSISQSAGNPVNQSVNQPIDQSVNQSANH